MILKPHQVQTVQYGIDNPYCIWALEMGLGKSAATISIAKVTGDKTLIVVPSYIKYNWIKEIKKFWPECRVSLLPHSRDYYKLWDTDIAIITYSFVHEADILFEWADRVVLEESHYVKGMEAKRTTETHRLIYENNIKNCNMLTGTPITNRVHDFYSQLAIAYYDPRDPDPQFLKEFPTWVDFAARFSYLKQYEMEVWKDGKMSTRQVEKWFGIRNQHELKYWLKGKYLRIKSEDVLDLPKVIEVDVELQENGGEQMIKEYMSMSKFLNSDGPVNSTAKKDAAIATAKFTAKYARDLISQGLPVIIYTDHPDACTAIARELEICPVIGGTKDKFRQQVADSFMEGRTMAVCGTFGAFSASFNLHVSGDIVVNDPPWTPGPLKQALFRMLRIGATAKRFRLHKMLLTSESRHIYEDLKEKDSAIKEAVEVGKT